jgi:hypothetical protein
MIGVLGCLFLRASAFAVAVLFAPMKSSRNSYLVFIALWNALTMLYLGAGVAWDGFGATDSPMSHNARMGYMLLLYGQNCGLSLLMAGLWRSVANLEQSPKTKKRALAPNFFLMLRAGSIMCVDVVGFLWVYEFQIQSAFFIGFVQIAVAIYLIRSGLILGRKVNETLSTHDDHNLKRFLARISFSCKLTGICSAFSFLFFLGFGFFGFSHPVAYAILETALVVTRAGSAVAQTLFCQPNNFSIKTYPFSSVAHKFKPFVSPSIAPSSGTGSRSGDTTRDCGTNSLLD